MSRAALALVGVAAPLAAAAQSAAAPAAAPTPKPRTLDAVTVTAVPGEAQTSIDRRSYSLGKDLQSTTGSIADALRNLPAVEVDAHGALSLRGDPNVTILVDGKPSPMFDGKGRADALQQLPADQIERVEVITTPSAALNPEGTGGVINLITKTTRGAGATGSAYVSAGSAGLKRAGVNLGYNTRTLALTGALSGNYQRNKQPVREVRNGRDAQTGAFLDNLDEGIGRNLTRGPSARLNLTWTATPKDQLTASGTYAEQLIYGYPFDRYEDDGPDHAPVSLFARQGKRRGLNIATGYTSGWRHTFGEGHELSFDGIYNQTLNRDARLFTTTPILPPTGVPLDETRDNGDEHHAELRGGYTRPLAGGSLKTGYEFKHDDDDYNFTDAKGPAVAALVPTTSLANHFLYHQTINAGFATYDRTFGDLGVQGGLRVEDTRLDLDQLSSGQTGGQHYTRVYPSLHLAWTLDADHKLTAGMSTRVQRPPAVLLNPLTYVLTPKDVQQGNLALKPKEARTLEVGYEQRHGQTSYQASLYYRKATNDFTNIVTPLGDGVFQQSFGNLGRSTAVGIDLTTNGRLSKRLTYNGGLNIYRNQINAANLGIVGGPRALTGVGGRFSLDWQAAAADLLQANLIVTGRHLQTQGMFLPVYTINLGWRHKVNDRVTATLTAQDLLADAGFRRHLLTADLVDRLDVEPVTRAVIFRLDYRFGGGAKAARPPAFEYEGAPGPG